jgi:GTPase-activator protein for Ras-like GTPase
MDKGQSRGPGSGRALISQKRADLRTTRYPGSTPSSVEKRRSPRYRVSFQDSSIRPVTPESINEALDDVRETHMGDSVTVSPSASPHSVRDGESEIRSNELLTQSGWNESLPAAKPAKEVSARPRTKTLEERPQDPSPSSFISRTRHRIGSVHAAGPNTFQGWRDTASSVSTRAVNHPSKVSSPAPPSTQPSHITKGRSRAGERQHPIKSMSRSGTRGTQPPPVSDSLPSPMPTEDANKILQLMRVTCGRMQGTLEFKTGAISSWCFGYCFIDEESGSLVHQEQADSSPQRTLVPDLRGCRIKTNVLGESQASEIEISTHTLGLQTQIRPSSSDQFDSWLAALLCWQPIRPKGAQNKMTKPQTPVVASERRLGDRRRNSDTSISKDTVIIKVGKMLLWDTGSHTKPASSLLSIPHGQRKMSTRPWLEVSSILQENGEFKLYTESDVTLLSVIQLSQLSRCAIQQLDRTVLDEDFCIGIYPQYTSTSTSLSLIRPVYLSLESRVLFEVWFVLLRAFTIPELYGPEQLRDENISSSLTMHGLFTASTTDMFRVERSLSLRIVEAKLGNHRTQATPESGLRARLPSAAERDTTIGGYFCEVWLDGEVRARTMLKSNTSNPFWREDYEFFDLPAVLSRTSIILKKGERRPGPVDVAMSNTSSSTSALGALNDPDGTTSGAALDVTYGKLEIELEDLDCGKETEGWWPLVNQRGENVGEMFLKLRAQELVVLMSRDYQQLSELLHGFSNNLTLQIARVIPSELRRLSETLLDIFQVSGQASEWLMTLVEEEIDGFSKEPSASRLRLSRRVGSNDSFDSTGDREILIRDLGKSATVEANLLFRGNSLLTKSLDLQMKRLGKEYLEDTLCEKLLEIQECDLDCEVDPARVHTTEELDKNWQNLLRLTEGVWDSISQSASRCPTELRKIFRHIRACAEDKYGDFLRTIAYSSVSGFLFLRFICPAVLNPKLFGLLRGKLIVPVNRIL